MKAQGRNWSEEGSSDPQKFLSISIPTLSVVTKLTFPVQNNFAGER